MATNSAEKRTDTDGNGIKLAPAPMRADKSNGISPFVQELRIVPRLEYPSDSSGKDEERVSTSADYQPAARDASRRWKRKVRVRNALSSLIILLASAVVLVPYILAAAGVTANAVPFRLVLGEYDVIGGWIEAFRQTAAAGWQAAAVKSVWLGMIPEMILTIGLLAVLINIVKAVLGLVGAIRPKRYTAGAVVCLLSVVAVFIAALVGAADIGVEQIDFMTDFIDGWQTSEFFTLFVTAGFNVVAAVICSFVAPLRTGYTRNKIDG